MPVSTGSRSGLGLPDTQQQNRSTRSPGRARRRFAVKSRLVLLGLFLGTTSITSGCAVTAPVLCNTITPLNIESCAQGYVGSVNESRVLGGGSDDRPSARALNAGSSSAGTTGGQSDSRARGPGDGATASVGGG